MAPIIPKAFFSYVRHVDDHDGNRLTMLRTRLQTEIRVQTGLKVEIFQDIREIKWGDDWRKKLLESAAGARFLIPVITPGYFLSTPCRDEYDAFKAVRTERTGSVILPIYYVDTDELNDPDWRVGNSWAEEIVSAQWADWRHLRLEPWETPAPNRRLVEMALALKDRLKKMGVLRPPSAAAAPAPTTAVPRPPVVAATPTPSAAAEAGNAETAPAANGSTVTSPAIQPTRRELVVDAAGQGNFRTITDALHAARADDVVLVRPGMYHESLVIPKSITLLGDGPREKIILQTASGNVIRFEAPFGRVANITIRRLVGDTDNTAIWITRGRLELDGCDITSASRACVAVSGEADPVVRRNRIHDGSQGGVFLYEQSRGTIEDNDIFGNGLSGLEIKAGADPIVRRNRIHGSKQGGVFVNELGRGTIEDNDIFENIYAGVEIKKSAEPVVRRNRIHDNKASGLYVNEQGRGTIEDNDIFGNASAGVTVAAEAEPTVKRNRINKNGYEGVWILKDGRGRFEENDLRDNKRGPWDIDKESLPHIVRSGNIEK